MSINQDKPSIALSTPQALASVLTIHSSDISVGMPPSTDGSTSVKIRPSREPPALSSSSTPMSDSYAAALHKIEQLCDTADESDSIMLERASPSSAEISFKTALSSLGTNSSARLGISREYDAGDELASFGSSSSSDSAWETESESDHSREAEQIGRRRLRYSSAIQRSTAPKKSISCIVWEVLLSLIGLLLPSRTPLSTLKQAVPWWRAIFTSLGAVILSGYIGKALLTVPELRASNAKAHLYNDESSVDIESTPPPTLQTVVSTPGIEYLESARHPHAQSLAELQLQIAEARASASASPLSLVSIDNLASANSTSHDALHYIRILSIMIAIGFASRLLRKALRRYIVPKPPQQGWRYIHGRKVYIRPKPVSSGVQSKDGKAFDKPGFEGLNPTAQPQPSASQEEPPFIATTDKLEEAKSLPGSSRNDPIVLGSDIEESDPDGDIASSVSSVNTIVAVPRSARTRSARIHAAAAKEDNNVARAASTPVRNIRTEAPSLTSRNTRAATMTPPGSDRVLRSHTKAVARPASPDRVRHSETPSRPIGKAKGSRGRQAPMTDASRDPTPLASTGSSQTRARTAPLSSAAEEIRPIFSKKCSSLPVQVLHHESFHLCFIHGAPGVGKASLLQRHKRGSFFDPAVPFYPGAESREEFRTFKDVQLSHFRKGNDTTTLVFGYGRMYDQPDEQEARDWTRINRIYTEADSPGSKLDNRGRNVHFFLYSPDDKVRQARLDDRNCRLIRRLLVVPKPGNSTCSSHHGI